MENYRPKAGDIVVITKKEGSIWNSEGRMDHWIGTVWTIQANVGGRLTFVDGGTQDDSWRSDVINSWSWYAHMVSPFITDVKIPFKRKLKI